MVRPDKRFTVASDILRPVRAAAIAVLMLLGLSYLIVPFYAVGQPVSTVMLWRQLTGARVQRQYVPLSRISPALALAVIVAEDGRICSHHGVDFAEIRDALADAEDLKDVRVGSTLTQQVAKNLFLWPGRSWLRKALELPLALWIDLVLSKRRILEIYLNIAEWGPSGEFGDVEVNFQDPPLRQHQVDPQCQGQLQRLAQPAAARPQEQVLRHLLGEGGTAAHILEI